MPACPSILCLLDGLSEAVFAFCLATTWPEVAEFLSRHAIACIAAAGALGLLFGWLAKLRTVLDAAEAAPEPVVPGARELKWRHEKLVLVERQQAEKQARFDAFIDRLPAFATVEEQTAALRVYTLAERVREARQKVGSDLSRMRAVRDRLDEISPPIERGREAVGASRGMAEAQAVRLEEAREALRGIAEEALRIEETVGGGIPDAAGLRRELMDLKGRIVSLPQGWATLVEETDRRLRELLATVDEPALVPVREVLLVDGSLTASLAGVAGFDLSGAVGAAIAVLDRVAEIRNSKSEVRNPESEPVDPVPEKTAEVSGTAAPSEPAPIRIGAGLEAPVVEEAPAGGGFDFGFPAPGTPSPGSRNPMALATLSRPAKGFHDLTGTANGHAAAAEPPCTERDGRSLVLFCSNDVELWGRTVYRGERCRARAIEEFPAWAHWISIRRLDTGERVFAPIRNASLRQGQSADPYGFNGTNELFYGARHLGLFSESCPNEVETRFTYGGWGFGHRAPGIAPEVEQLQAAGWEGREIPSDTVFEIAIHEELPSLGANDRLLDEGAVPVNGQR